MLRQTNLLLAKISLETPANLLERVLRSSSNCWVNSARASSGVWGGGQYLVIQIIWGWSRTEDAWAFESPLLEDILGLVCGCESSGCFDTYSSTKIVCWVVGLCRRDRQRGRSFVRDACAAGSARRASDPTAGEHLQLCSRQAQLFTGDRKQGKAPKAVDHAILPRDSTTSSSNDNTQHT